MGLERYQQGVQFLKKSPLACEAREQNLLGVLYRNMNMHAKAIDCFQKSLAKNPLMWSSFKAICELDARHAANCSFGIPTQNLSSKTLNTGDFASPRALENTLNVTTRSSRAGARRAANPFKSITTVVNKDKEKVPESHNSSSLNQDVQILADAFRLCCLYKSSQSLSALKRLSTAGIRTRLYSVISGKSHFDLYEYQKAFASFSQVFLNGSFPFSVHDSRWLSSVIWQLKKPLEASYLAQRCLDVDRHSPDTWITLGNCFSMHGEHDKAIKYLKRACSRRQQDAYVHTLLAHEYVATESFQPALEEYRKALSISPSHYNAWYGIGNIYYRQEKYDLACFHFQRAISFNSESSFLFCYLGMVVLT